MVWMDNARIALREDWHSFPDYTDYRTQSTTFEDMAIFNGTSRTLTGDGEPERVLGAHSSPNLFDVLGVPADSRPRVFGRARTTPEPTTSSCCRTVCGSGGSAAVAEAIGRHGAR